MRILIYNTASWSGFDSEAEEYKSKLARFKYEEIRDDRGHLLKTYVEINSLDDLEKLNKAVDHELILDFRKDEEKLIKEPYIEIYDFWRE